jgi:Flp pilus assembly protein TadD
LLLLAVGLVFGQTVRYEFVNIDDDRYVYDNQQVSQGLTIPGIAWVFTNSHGDNWHPLTGISHLLDCHVYGLNAGGHHLTNVLLHVATAMLLFVVLWRMSGGFWPSALVAALFAVHPLRVESVAWVSERKDVLSGLFFVVTLAGYLHYVRKPFFWGRYLLVMALFALGLMAKPMLVTLPAVLLLLDYWPLRRMTSPTTEDDSLATPPQPGRCSSPMHLLVEKLPLLLLSAVSCVLTLWAQREALVSVERLPPLSRIGNAMISYVAYLDQLFYPAGLALLYPHPGAHLPVWKVAGAMAVLACISAAAAASWRRCPYLLVGWLWYAGMLVPVSGLLQVAEQAMADRFTYLPQIGLCIALAWGAADVVRSWPNRRWLCGVTLTMALAALMVCAWRQTVFWGDNMTLWNRTLACTSRNFFAYSNLGNAFLDRKQFERATAQFERALAINPRYAEARNNLGIALVNEGQVDEAIKQFRQGLIIRPSNAGAHKNLGIALATQGKIDEAINQFRQAIVIKPTDAEAHYQLAVALAGREQVEEAVVQYREDLALRPDHAETHNNLAWLLATCPAAALRNGAKAVTHAQRAQQFLGNVPGVLDTLAAAYAEAGRFPEALATARKALDLATQQHDQPLANGLRARIVLYESGKPYHEAPSASAPPPKP